MEGEMKRIFAANRVIDQDGAELKPGVVEIDGLLVDRSYRMCGEQPFTEWIGGTVSIRRCADGTLRAYKDGIALTEYYIGQ